MGRLLGRGDLSDNRNTAIRLLVETALQSLATEKRSVAPRNREEWIERLSTEFISTSETSHQAALSALMSTGVSRETVFQSYIPAVARRIGEMWVRDEATFVQVTIGAGRLQALYQDGPAHPTGQWIDRTIPLGQSVLMVLPDAEDHTLGAFAAADQFRRHGIWVRMAIRLKPSELVSVIEEGGFSMLGFSATTQDAAKRAAAVIDFLRAKLDRCAPIVVGGRQVQQPEGLGIDTGADYTVRTVREAVEKCRLATVAQTLSIVRTE